MSIETAMPWQLPTGRRWHCQLCGFTSPWWTGCDRFPMCAKCDRAQRMVDAAARRADIAQSEVGAIPPGYTLVGRPLQVRETEKAILFALADRQTHWVPKSAIAQHPRGVIVQDWIYRKIAGRGGSQAA